MFESSFEEEMREVRFLFERLAESEAMPLRMITEIDARDLVARLDCGHRKQLFCRRSVGAPIRCQMCFEERMQEARRMIDQ